MAIDKTGTLTERFAEVTDVVAVDGEQAGAVLALAAAVESSSDHPIATAVLGAAGRAAAAFPVPVATDVRSVAGIGVSGSVDGRLVEVGRVVPEGLDPVLAEAVDRGHARGETVVVVLQAGGVLGVLAVATPLRPEAVATIDHLGDLGLAATILSGDSAPAVDHVADQLGIDRCPQRVEPVRQGGRPVRDAQ